MPVEQPKAFCSFQSLVLFYSMDDVPIDKIKYVFSVCFSLSYDF